MAQLRWSWCQANHQTHELIYRTAANKRLKISMRYARSTVFGDRKTRRHEEKEERTAKREQNRESVTRAPRVSARDARCIRIRKLN